MNKFFLSGQLRKVIAVVIFFILAGNFYTQDEKPAETPTQTTPENPVDENAPEKTTEETPKAEAPSIIINNAVQKVVNEQLRWTPADPSFLYETRNIPDHKNKEEFLPEELEKVIVKERIKEERDFRKSLEKIKIRLPDLTQTIVLVSIIIILLVYRSRARKSRDTRR